jgi:hypothetical protein
MDGPGDASTFGLQMSAGLGYSRCRHIAFELRERREDTKHQTIQRGDAQFGGGDDVERDGVIPQFLKERDEMPQVSGQPVQPMDDHPFHAAGPHDSEQPLKRWPVEPGSRVSIIIETLRDQFETLGAQRLNVCAANFKLHLA